MSATTLAAPVGAATPPAAPAAAGGGGRWEFTAAEFWQLVDQGFFGSQRVQLIDGEVRVIPPPGNLHELAVDLLLDALRAAFGPQYWVRSHGGGVELSPRSVPAPDLSVVAGSRQSHFGQRKAPTTAVLVVEVSDSTLSDDRNEKASLYAAAGIADYWILNIPGRQLEVRRDPQPDPAEKFGHGYASLVTLRPGDVAAPLEVPAARIPVADLMPH